VVEAFKKIFDTSKSHNVILAITWFYVAAILIDFGQVSDLSGDQILISIAAIGGLILLVGGFIVEKQSISQSLSNYGVFATLFSVTVYSFEPSGTLVAGIWWFILVFGLAMTAKLYSIMVVVSFLAYIVLALNEGAAFDKPLAFTFLATAAAVVSGTLVQSFGLAKSKSSPKTTSQLNPEILLDSIADGIIVVDSNKRISVFNRAASDITGWPINDALGLDYRSILMLIEADGSKVVDNANPIFAVLNGMDSVRDNNALLATKSRKTVDLSLIVSPIKDEEDKTISAVGIFRDITQEKNEQKQRAEFISTASHEMRTPVAAIEGYLALAMNDKVTKIDSKARDYLEKAHSSTKHLGKLFQDLLTAAKSEDGRLSNHPLVVDVSQFIDEIVESAKFAAEKQGLLLKDDTKNIGRVEVDKVRPLSYMYVDPDRLREVITNIIDNAIKYTEEGRVTIGLHTDDREVTFSVQDTGQGIPPEDLKHLFQKFYRVDNSATRQVGGTGLGLFISRKIVELYKGRIWAESELGVGSIFYVSIPRITAAEAQRLQQQTTTIRNVSST
jgi:PAS domain S-box-containing protein